MKRNDFITREAKKRGMSPQEFVKRILAREDLYSNLAVKRANAYKVLLTKASGGLFDLYDKWDSEDSEEVKENTAPTTEEVEQKGLEVLKSQSDIARRQRSREMINSILSSQYERRPSPYDQPNSQNPLPGIPSVANYATTGSGDLSVVKNAAERNGIPPEILAGIYGAESSFGRNAGVSSAGAQGPFQFMSGTAKQYGVNPYDLGSSADGAARYLKDLYSQFGNWEKAVAAYNAGPGNIQKGRYSKETRDYVPKVFGYAKNVKFESGGTYDLSPEEIIALKKQGYKIKFDY